MRADGYDDESITSTFRSHLKSIVGEYSTMQKMNGSSNIVNCDDVHYESHADGFGWDVYIKMELLTPLVDSLPKSISEETVVKVGTDICAALELCQRHGVIHRDIKPQNIFISPHGDYKLGDFGIAKTVEKTMGGTITGTYKYMAPEVYNNQPYGAAADQYSLGMVLYWMLNERRVPFVPLGPAVAGAEDAAKNRRFSGESIPAPKNGSEELKQIVLKACAFDPKDRFASAAEMLQALRDLGKSGAATVGVMESSGKRKDDVSGADDATVGPEIHRVEDGTVGPGWNGRDHAGTQDDDKTVGPVFADNKAGNEKPNANSRKNLILRIAAIGAVILILILLMRSCLDGAAESAETEPDETISMETEETETQTNQSVTESEETLSVQLEWSEWMDALPEYVNATVYDVEEQTLYRSRNLEITSSTTATAMDGWDFVKTVEGTGEFGLWSTWSDKKVTETDNREVESRTRYRYRTKETTTSSSSAKSGWTLYDTTYTVGGYGSWSSWSTTKATASDSRQVESKVQYSYRDKCTEQGYSDWSEWSDWSTTREETSELKKEDVGTEWAYYSYYCTGCYQAGWASEHCYNCNADSMHLAKEVEYYDVSWDNARWETWKYNSNYQVTYTVRVWGEGCFKGDKTRTVYRYATRTPTEVTKYSSWSDYSDTVYTASSTREVRTRTVYRYRDRQQVPTYHFYRWNSWSAWSENVVSVTDNRQVETTKFYRYRDRVTEETHYFQRWTGWTEYLPEEITASETTEVETKQQFRFRSKGAESNY